MTERKTIKRAVKAVWDDVKTLRSERGKSYSAADIKLASEALTGLAGKLAELAGEMSKPSPMPPGEPASPKTKKRKSRKKSEA